MAIEHCGIPLTADAIKTKLLDMEESGNGGDNSAVNSSGAFASYKKNRNVGNTSTKDNAQMSMSKPKVITCYKCKQTGHYRNQCTFSNKNSSNTNKNERTRSNAFSAVFLNGEFCKSDWYIDSGASVHLTANEEWLSNVSRDLRIKEIVVANKDKVPVLCTGDVQITTKTHACEYDITVEGVLCVPKLTTNLLSVSQLISRGNKVLFNNNGCQIFNKAGILVATACLLNGVYKLNMSEHCLTAAMTVSSEVWHRRLGHVNSQYLNKMQDAVEGLTIDSKIDISKSSCVACCEGKQSRLPFPKEGSRSTELLHIVHTDLCGPMENRSIGGSRYFMLFIDDFSRMTYIYFLKSKDEALKCFQQYKAEVENQLNCKIKILRSDNGTEFCNSKFDDFLMSHGIVHHKTNPYTPEQNGLSERYNRTIVEKAKCLLFDAGLEKRFWAEAAHTAVYLQNRTVTTSLNYRTPFEIWTGRKPDVSHLRIFGSTIMVHVPKQKRLKWDRKAEKCILVGYSNDVKGYRIYNPKSNVITTSRDVIVLEEIETENNVLEVQENCSDDVNIVPVGEEDLTLQEVSHEQSESLSLDDSGEIYVPCENETLDSSESGTTDSEDSIIFNNVNVISGPRRRQQPDRFGFASACIEDDQMFTGEILLQEALEGPEKAQWLEAVQEELQSFEKNSAWELVDVPKDGTIVQCKWVLRKKYDSENNVRYRARLVAKGFTQKYGVDYTDTFSPVVRHTTLRLLFALSVKLGLNVTHLDVKTAFLNGDLEETIYMKIPDCYNSSSSPVTGVALHPRTTEISVDDVRLLLDADDGEFDPSRRLSIEPSGAVCAVGKHKES
ncbi:Retrovirus-related Pol polyprotein from transposon TNT 1-94 [Eumeta japonica]|uniref:Retrovirus-related Pol polyprotein from transposon TNT 1-94 n=1 Tax=Eumeta variegata TaxID=151549 RepID=A0A4C1W3H1_EUMVA|nr:Retrovirus-related Pol polyprotein from transposon TNT 1-94 [Eumeta japonica]